jgi:hypothetical protein
MSRDGRRGGVNMIEGIKGAHIEAVVRIRKQVVSRGLTQITRPSEAELQEAGNLEEGRVVQCGRRWRRDRLHGRGKKDVDGERRGGRKKD